MYLTTKQILETLSIKTERFRAWIKLGYIKPGIKAEGPGRKHLWKVEQLFQVAVMLELIEAGLKVKVSSEIVKYLDFLTWKNHILNVQKVQYLHVQGKPNKKRKISEVYGWSITDESWAEWNFETHTVGFRINLTKIVIDLGLMSLLKEAVCGSINSQDRKHNAKTI